jgi:hypothetical protein
MNDPFRPTATDGFNIEPSSEGKGNQHVELERAMLYWLQNSSMAFFTFFNELFVTTFDYFDLLWQNRPNEKIYHLKTSQKLKENQTL